MVKIPEKRDAVLYVRVKPSIKKFVYLQSIKNDISESKWINLVLENEKAKAERKNARKSTKAKRSSRRSK